MKSETRANLIFLGLFVVISLPGAIILFRKKLDPAAPSMAAPDAVHSRLAYTAPVADNPNARRIVPPQTAEWLTRLKIENGGDAISAVRSGGDVGGPAIADDRSFEVLGIVGRPEGDRIVILDWAYDAVKSNGPITVEAGADATSLSPATVQVDTLTTLPAAVRKELADLGHASPPT